MPPLSQTVACFGASLTEGTVSSNYLELLAERPELAGFRFANHGVNGELAWNGLQRLDKVIAGRPDFVTILIGTNDINATLSERNRLRYVTFNHLPVTTPDLAWYRENMRAIVTRLQTETSARIAFLSLPMIGEDLEHVANQRVELYNEATHRLARESGTAYLPLYEQMVAYLKEHEADQAHLPPRLAYRDGLTNVGNAIALHASGLSWDEVSHRNGLLLLTDTLHLNRTGAGMIADLVSHWLIAPAGERVET